MYLLIVWKKRTIPRAPAMKNVTAVVTNVIPTAAPIERESTAPVNRGKYN